MKIALYYNKLKEKARAATVTTLEYLAGRGVNAKVVSDDQIPFGPAKESEPFDVCLIIGGDGTILRFLQLQRAAGTCPPLLGVNLGGLGFMADISPSDLELCLDDLLKGSFSIEKRQMLELCLRGDGASVLNEVVLHRGANAGLVDLTVSIRDQLVNAFSCDGLIIATPNGSTAYSLSAGGPIVTPNVRAAILTPICPHALFNRPLVLSPAHPIKIELTSSEVPIDVVVDGCAKFSLEIGQVATIGQSRAPFRWIQMHRSEYFATLRGKLAWGGSLKNRT